MRDRFRSEKLQFRPLERSIHVRNLAVGQKTPFVPKYFIFTPPNSPFASLLLLHLLNVDEGLEVFERLLSTLNKD